MRIPPSYLNVRPAPPLRDIMLGVMRVFGESVPGQVAGNNPIVAGLFDIDAGDEGLLSLTKALFWEQGRPEGFRSVPPREILYRLPYHRITWSDSPVASASPKQLVRIFIRLRESPRRFLPTLRFR